MKTHWKSIVLKNDGMKHKPLLLLILLAAVLIRLPVAAYMGDQVTVLPGIHDQLSYDALAHSLLDGRGYSFTANWYPFTPANTPTSHWSFAYPLYLAGIYALTGDHPLVARIVQSIVGGALICYLIYRIGRRLANEATGIVAAALAAAYGYLIYYNAALMTETFFIVLVLLSLYISLGLKKKASLARWALLGLTLGLAALLKQSILLFVPFLLLWLIWDLKKHGVRWWYFFVPIVVIVLLIAPWTLRNYKVYHQYLLLNSNSGYALYASNNPNLGTNWRNEVVVVPVPDELIGLNEAQLDRALTQRGIEYIISNPGRYFLLSLNKTLEYFRFWPSTDSSEISNLNRVLSFGLYLPFMLFGLGISVKHWRSFGVLYLFMVIHTGTYLLSWPSPRYRLPVDAVLMVFAGLALLELAKQFRTWRQKVPVTDQTASRHGERR
jgi:4-amino-4-deoxy-L-arabinose transferase-like glycosyltransferase